MKFSNKTKLVLSITAALGLAFVGGCGTQHSTDGRTTTIYGFGHLTEGKTATTIGAGKGMDQNLSVPRPQAFSHRSEAASSVYGEN